ncbi:MAG: NADH-quinone oxidoreductase subunit NuoG, partial [Pseudomonadota bacterium]
MGNTEINMINVTVDGVEHRVPAGVTVLQACEFAGKEIPRFCYHDRLSIAGNCRMCLVEIKPGPPKPAASCAMPAGEGMQIFTDSEMVRKGRAGVMEFLLINHPLDCPICDQGGECDLQDQAMAYGRGVSSYREEKRAVENKYMGPLINTIMTRCIHCTRCVRFASEIAGVDNIGLLGRGENAEISTLEQVINSEISGNLIDLCPVGALTSSPYAFVARPWELEKTNSIDVFDAVGSNIRVDTRGGKILRILPRLHEDINEEWISDKVRFSFDAMRLQRLDQPWLRDDQGKLNPCEWDHALTALKKQWSSLKGSEIGVVIGDQVDCETMFALKKLCAAHHITNIDCRADGSMIDNQQSESYLFNTTIAGLEQADAMLIIGSHIRWEAPLIHARIRKSWLQNNLTIGVVGEKNEFAFDYKHLGADASTLLDIANGTHDFCKILKAAKNPVLILGAHQLARKDAKAIEQLTKIIAEKYNIVSKSRNGYNILHHAASRVGGLLIGLLPEKDGLGTREMEQQACHKDGLKSLWLIGVDHLDLKDKQNCFIIYQGHHGDQGAKNADLILPGASFCEKNATWVNLEGRVQLSQRSLFPPNKARDDWKIIRAIAAQFEYDLGFDDFETLRRN